MKTEGLINAHIDFSKFGDLKKLASLQKRVLFILYVIEKEFGIPELSSQQIADMLTNKIRIRTSRESVDTTIRRAGSRISTTKKEGINYHKIMSAGIEDIQDGIEVSQQPKKVLDLVIPDQVVAREKGYFQKVIYQINGCYQDGYYDASFVMIRRAVETLIIEVYEHLGLEKQIREPDGNYCSFNKLIDAAMQNPKIKLSKIARSDLKTIKKFGDTAAHNRRLNLIKQDIDKHSDSIRLIIDELIGNKS